MTRLWTAPAEVLTDQADPGWEGIWTLTYAAGHAAINLGLAVPLGVAVDLAYAAMDFREAQDELEWAHPDLPARCAAVDLGQLDPTEGEPRARLIIDQLATAALHRAIALATTDLDVPDLLCLARVTPKLFTGRAKVTGRMP
ncbi:hypothetical protein [Cellulomonas sp. P24]|uniref:hypothetical protein n=1 Tax=Cellulomonas sp. P24 TaxID=2885206 RepID=UPI00216B01DD|nr:hypothetical protein [Cellulomonas sp. P24]MCR6494501.1 hypothetical protein [Cellulomonas sp. P24]